MAASGCDLRGRKEFEYADFWFKLQGYSMGHQIRTWQCRLHEQCFDDSTVVRIPSLAVFRQVAKFGNAAVNSRRGALNIGSSVP